MSEPSQFLIYTAPDGAVKVDVFIKDETVWLTQKALAEAATVSKMEIVRSEGGRKVRREVDFYDLTQEEFQHILITFPLVDESVKSQTLNTYRELVKLGKFAENSVQLNR